MNHRVRYSRKITKDNTIWILKSTSKRAGVRMYATYLNYYFNNKTAVKQNSTSVINERNALCKSIIVLMDATRLQTSVQGGSSLTHSC